MSPENWWLENEISFWDGLFSGAMLVFGGVHSIANLAKCGGVLHAAKLRPRYISFTCIQKFLGVCSSNLFALHCKHLFCSSCCFLQCICKFKFNKGSNVFVAAVAVILHESIGHSVIRGQDQAYTNRHIGCMHMFVVFPKQILLNKKATLMSSQIHDEFLPGRSETQLCWTKVPNVSKLNATRWLWWWPPSDAIW